MRKWLALLILGCTLALPSRVASQEPARLASLDVKLWPEYDQPKMLVIYDFQLAEGTTIPAQISFRLPKDAEVNAVAASQNGDFVNGNFESSDAGDGWQSVTVFIDSPTAYRIEYYEPLKMTGSQREFAFTWPGDFDIHAFTISVQEPVDTTSMSTDPAYPPKKGSDGLTYHSSPVASLKQGETFTLAVKYDKTSQQLTVPSTDIKPSAPLNENTPGRVSLSNYLPYIIGALGVTLVVGGLGYYLLWGKPRSVDRRPRRRTRARPSESADAEIYCHQCGQRARPADRFCRVCGTRLRQQEN